MSEKITESPSLYDHLDQMPTAQLLENINTEDHKVPTAVKACIPQIEPLVDVVADRLLSGGRLFYLGAGTSGRLGILDASECPPTFGVPHDLVVGLIAGGDGAIRKAVEHAEDSEELGWKDLQSHAVNAADVVIGIAASGTTPYVVGALQRARKQGIVTGCITCNANTPIADQADFPIEVIVGPEFITGSTRMKAGTAQKLVLNMISTSVMIKLGRVKGNRMVDMQLNNAKLVNRGIAMVQDALNCSEQQAMKLLETHKSVRMAIAASKQQTE